MKKALIYDYSEHMEHDKWVKEIPFIEFPKGWKVQMTPPFSGALVRFRVEYERANVSVYLDCYGNLGMYGLNPKTPYWEVYPYAGDVARLDMNDIDGLLKAISESIISQNTGVNADSTTKQEK